MTSLSKEPRNPSRGLCLVLRRSGPAVSAQTTQGSLLFFKESTKSAPALTVQGPTCMSLPRASPVCLTASCLIVLSVITLFACFSWQASLLAVYLHLFAVVFSLPQEGKHQEGRVLFYLSGHLSLICAQLCPQNLVRTAGHRVGLIIYCQRKESGSFSSKRHACLSKATQSVNASWAPLVCLTPE